MSTYTDSVAAQISMTMQGLWIHDPLDPEGTVQQYIYGKAARSTSIDMGQKGLVFAGRTYPVFEYGEHQEDEYDVSIPVPFDANWQTTMGTLSVFGQARKTVCVRDNRGRIMFGSISNYKENDEDWGTEVSFNISRADYDESVV